MRTAARPFSIVPRRGAWPPNLPPVILNAMALRRMLPGAVGCAVRIISYQAFFDKSDLVAIVTATARTADTAEELILPGLSTQDAQGRLTHAKCIGVETPFAVAVVLKGDRNIR